MINDKNNHDNIITNNKSELELLNAKYINLQEKLSNEIISSNVKDKTIINLTHEIEIINEDTNKYIK